MIPKVALETRKTWINEIIRLSGEFSNDSTRLASELELEVQKKGLETLKLHLRLCGAIPESYDHDSSEEKLYSKYTDILIAMGFQNLGINSHVMTERADAADVECEAKDFNFVADAKSFRLSRTAKNQKDFKIQAMDGWRRTRTHAMVVCPIYQLPSRESQIYQQAAARNVCIFTYSHLCLLLSYCENEGETKAQGLLLKIFKCVEAMNPTKDAWAYWLAVNTCILNSSKSAASIWKEEKLLAIESIKIAKEEALSFLIAERSKILSMSREAAIKELIKTKKIDSKIKYIESVGDNGLLNIGE